MARGRRGASSISAALLAAAVIVTSLVVVQDSVAASSATDPPPPDWVDDLDPDAWGADAGPEQIPWEDSPAAPLVLPDGADGVLDVPAEFPEPAAWDVELAGEGEAAALVEGSVESAGTDVADAVDAADDLPVTIAAGTDDASGEQLRVEVFDRAMAESAGASGFVFAVDAVGDDVSVADIADDRELPAELEIDYSGFAGAYGGDYATRLQVVALPACALEEPRPAGCPAQGTRLEARNDMEDGRLVVEVPDLAALTTGALAGPADMPIGPEDAEQGRESGGFGEADLAAEAAAPPMERAEVPQELAPFESSPRPTPGPVPAAAAESAEAADAAVPVDGGAVVLAVTSGVGGDTGTHAATPLSMSGQWNVSPGSGEFSYSYPLDVPAPAAGAAPSVGLGYSSGAVDGLTLGTNTQAPATGVGWSDFANGFIDRSYEPCVNAGFLLVQDLCWRNWNATISLGGVSGVLTPIDADFREWRVKNDPGWRIQRFGGPGEEGVVGERGGEHWKVTAPDGTQYFFGLYYDPTTQNLGAPESTLSTWWVPVFADQPTDPCWNTEVNGVGRCNMAWRWNLDRVVDPNGNLTTYWYSRESNRYEMLNGMNHRYAYVRSGMLEEIRYGARTGTQPGFSSKRATGRVTFGLQNRCVYLVAECPAAASNGSNAAFPDVPWDLICDTQAICPTTSPSFFNGRRYSHVRTEVWVDDGVFEVTDDDWVPVLQYNLIHRIVMHSTTAGKMYLDKIQHVGIARGGLVPYPATLFTFQQMANRADVGASAGLLRMVHWRVVQVTNPFGARINVTYFRNRACTATDFAQDWWDQNDKDCFPQTVYDNNHRRRGVFNKYLVSQVVETPGHGSPAMTTTYTYEGTPAWAFDYGAFDRFEERTGWSQWQGYETTLVTQGTSTTRTRVFRGMDGDLEREVRNGQPCACGSREVEVQTLDELRSFTDQVSLAGRTLEHAALGELDGVTDVALQATLYEYETLQTADPVHDEYDFDAPRWADVSATTESIAVTPTEVRQRGTRTTYNANRQPETTEELGWLGAGAAGDERCSLTTYADNPASWMFVYPATNRTLAGTCDAPGAELAMSTTLYDNTTTVGAAPTRGNPTRQSTRVDATGPLVETSTAFDALGRPVAVTDARGNTATTTYTADPAHAIPTQVAAKNGLHHQTVTTYMPEFSVPLRVQDPNNNVTTYAYDALGRMAEVRLPTEQAFSGTQTRSWQFSYLLSFDSVSGGAGSVPPIVRSGQLASIPPSGVGVYENSWVVYDGNLRERQTQAQSPTSGRVLATTTSYDGRGLVHDVVAPEAVPGTPGVGLVAPAGGANWANRTRHSYDELGRETRQEWMRGLAMEHRTISEYVDEDTVRVTGPGPEAEAGVVEETVDGLGRTVEIRELDGLDTVGDEVWATTAYGYDLADNLTSITDAEGNEITYSYDMVGRRTGQDDPNRGAASFGYDLAGNPTVTQDANGDQVHTVYDVLGRPTHRRADDPATGALLASWTYDSAPGGVGQADRSVRHTAGGDWVTEVAGYDLRGRATGSTLTVPAGVPGLSGSYAVSQTYDRADRPLTTSYPAVGGLPAEPVTTAYNGFGLPATLTGAASYVRSTAYDGRGRVSNSVFGPTNPSEPVGQVWAVKSWAYDADQQLSSVELLNSAATGSLQRVSRHELSYDNAGRVADRTAEVSGLGAWRECYGYDRRDRLTEAHTVAFVSGGSCAGGVAGTGDRPFEDSYAYTSGNAISQRVEDGVTTDYAYDDTGADPPYAPVQVGGVSLEWDANGNLTERTEGGATEVFSWDVEQRLTSVAGPGEASSFVYDAGGQRLLRRTADGSTLYVAGHEVTASADGSSVTAVRSYGFGGGLVATRSSAGLQYVVTDERGSVEMSAPSGGVPSASRAYAPYGQEHAASGSGFATDRGFLGQVEDEPTSLSYLNARYYDASAGVFVSPDPVYDTGNPRSLNPYTYGLGNPTTFSDASGLSPSYILGIENQNAALRQQNSQLIAHIGTLNANIEELQGIIVEQRNIISQLLTRVSALEAIIRQQAVVIRNLQARVRQLTAQVAYWRGRAMYYRSIVHQQAVTIWNQAIKINDLTGFLQRRPDPRRVTDVVGFYGLNRYLPRIPGSSPAMASSPMVTGLRSVGPPPLPPRPRRSDPVEQQIADVQWEMEYQVAVRSDEYRAWVAAAIDISDAQREPNEYQDPAYCDELGYASYVASAADVGLTHDPVSEIPMDIVEGALLAASSPCYL